MMRRSDLTMVINMRLWQPSKSKSWGTTMRSIGSFTSRLLWPAIFVSLLAPSEAMPQIIVNNDAQISDVLTMQPLIGYRKASKEFFASVNRKDQDAAGIPVVMFVQSASATKSVSNAVSYAGKDPKSATLDDWYAATKAVGPNNNAQPEGLISIKAGLGRTAAVDPQLVANLSDTELFIAAKPVTYEAWNRGAKTQYMVVDASAYQKFAQSYDTLEKAKGERGIVAQQRFASADATLAAYPLLKSAAKFEAGEVTLGKPIVYTADEKKLGGIPGSIRANNDIYWIEFAVSYRNIDTQKIDRLIFGVNGPAGSVALELIPLRHGRQTTTKETRSSPEITIQVGDKAVTVGKVYEQEVVYSSLKPTIVAQGLQESEFAWTMSDDAIQVGAQRFIAVMAIPKSRRSIIVQLQASARTKAGWFAQGDIVSISPVVNEIPLR